MNDVAAKESATVQAVGRLYGRSLSVLESLRDHAASPPGEPRQAPRSSITRAAELVGRTSAAIREAEKEGRVPAVARTSTNRRVGYSLAEINRMREVFGTRPWRTVGDPVAVIAVQNSKEASGNRPSRHIWLNSSPSKAIVFVSSTATAKGRRLLCLGTFRISTSERKRPCTPSSAMLR